MRRNPRRSGIRFRRCLAASAATVVLLALCGCASHRPAAATPASSPAEVFRSLLGSNPGLTSIRAVAETRLAFAGREISLPGVLLLDSSGGFRLDLLDPLDRPVAMLFVEDKRIVHYRPGPGLAASLGVFPEECRGVDPTDWVSAILASSIDPIPGETVVDASLWGRGRVLERHRGGHLHQSVRYRKETGRNLPHLSSWYCGEDPVLQLRLLEWVQGSSWRLPSRFEIDFPLAGLSIRIELSEIEANPESSSRMLRPRLGSETLWTTWNLPQ